MFDSEYVYLFQTRDEKYLGFTYSYKILNPYQLKIKPEELLSFEDEHKFILSNEVCYMSRMIRHVDDLFYLNLKLVKFRKDKFIDGKINLTNHIVDEPVSVIYYLDELDYEN